MAFCCSNVQIMVLLCRNRGTLYRCLEKRVQCPRICRKSFIQTQPLIASLCWPHKQILVYTLAPLTVCTGCHKKETFWIAGLKLHWLWVSCLNPLWNPAIDTVLCWVFLAHLGCLLKALCKRLACECCKLCKVKVWVDVVPIISLIDRAGCQHCSPDILRIVCLRTIHS